MNIVQEKKETLLPPPELLERYENISAGLSKDLVELVKNEQLHRHKLQDRYLMHFRLGQIFGSLFLIYVVYSIFELAKDGEFALAYLMTAMFGLLIALILSQYRKDKLSAVIRNSSRVSSLGQARRTTYKRSYIQKR